MADSALSIPRMSAAEYLRIERQETQKHEFVDGVVYAMAGASKRHNDIMNGVRDCLSPGIANPCRIYTSDVQVHINAGDKERYYYPDVVVTCTDLDTDEYLISCPALIVEVLSRSTEGADRGYKFEHYRMLPSLQEYLLVHQERRCAELYRRRTNWEKEHYEPEAEITFESVSVAVPIAAFYRRVAF